MVVESEKVRLNEGAAMTPCGECAYIAGWEEEPEGKDWAGDGRATCMLVLRASWGEGE